MSKTRPHSKVFSTDCDSSDGLTKRELFTLAFICAARANGAPIIFKEAIETADEFIKVLNDNPTKRK